jgi:hypothetical protein
MQALLSCVTRQNKLLWDGADPDRRHSLILPRRETVRLRGPICASLGFEQRFDVLAASSGVGEWSLIGREYSYTLGGSDGRNLLAYHLHPSALPVTWPHLHLGPAAGGLLRAVATAHLPTGTVEPEDVLFLAIRELGVEPLRENWPAILGPGRAVTA